MAQRNENQNTGAIMIRQAELHDDLNTVQQLFEAYTKSLGIDLTFQSYETELASLPGAYATPQGALLLATESSGAVLGCVAVRSCPYSNEHGTVCEAKRLYVTPEGRGKGTGRALIEAAISAAKRAAYEEMRLDTLGNMKDAQRLYERLGFSKMDAYYENPNEGTVYMVLKLRKHQEGP